MSQADNIFT